MQHPFWGDVSPYCRCEAARALQRWTGRGWTGKGWPASRSPMSENPDMGHPHFLATGPAPPAAVSTYDIVPTLCTLRTPRQWQRIRPLMCRKNRYLSGYASRTRCSQLQNMPRKQDSRQQHENPSASNIVRLPILTLQRP